MRFPRLILAGTLAAFAVPAVAETAPVAVRYSDLDLSTGEGQAKLERRIDSAARTACGMGEIRTGRFTPSTAQRQCYQQTKASVHEQVAERIARDNSRG